MVAQVAELQVPRISAETDIPADISAGERTAYVAGYAKGCRAYVRKYGGASVSLDGPSPKPGTPERKALGEELARMTREHETERHPSAHRAGMLALKKYRARNGIEIPAAPKPARKTAARKPRALSVVPDVEKPAPVETQAPESRVIVAAVPTPALPPEKPAETPQGIDALPFAERKAARRKLAEEMRAAGIEPRGEAWETAKRYGLEAVRNV